MILGHKVANVRNLQFYDKAIILCQKVTFYKKICDFILWSYNFYDKMLRIYDKNMHFCKSCTFMCHNGHKYDMLEEKEEEKGRPCECNQCMFVSK